MTSYGNDAPHQSVTPPQQMTGRLILDVTSLLRWSGPPVGIARVEHALATAARQRPDTVLACFDPEADHLRALDPQWQDLLLGWSAMLDRHQPRTGLRRWLPQRQPIVAALERLRLTTRQAALARAADLAQRAILGVRPHGFVLYDADGKRFATVPRDLGLAGTILPQPGDTLLSAGNGWSANGLSCLAAARRHAARTTVLCYDLIPITHPHFYAPDVAQHFAAYWRRAIPLLDRIIVNAACIAADLRHFCREERLPLPELVQRPLGFDPPAPTSARPPLPPGLRPGNYALFVSTIEPRKGHAMLLRAWDRLLARGIPQRTGFRLVFVGREGWMVDAVMADLADPHRGTVLHLPQIGDPMLDALYAGAAFCLYPSVYEGFGLPIIEAFARGLPVLASTGGAIPETAGGLVPCLDPLDDAAWAGAIETWLIDPAAKHACANRIRTGFSHPGWPAAAAAILDAAVLQPSNSPRPPPHLEREQS